MSDDDMHEVVRAIGRIRRNLAEMPAGPERDQLVAGFERFRVKFLAMPAKVAAAGAMKSAAEFRDILDRVLREALAELQGN